ncbi:MAG: YdcF family protein [Burkholderiales bacterium]|nr:YdcF family protein [Burkholderiales bacterium]
MFLLSKLLSLITQPLGWVAALLLLALFSLQRKPQRAQRLLVAALALLLLIGWQPLPDLLVRQLESYYPEFAPDADLRGFAGVIVLGGATESGYVSAAHSLPQVTDGAERLTAAVALLQRHPALYMVYSGGEGALLGSGPSEAERARAFFASLGATGPRMRYEAVSRNTYENAVLTAKMDGIDITQRWLLVTSAWHMPRSMGTFQKAGWNVTAYPVDFRTAPSTPWTEYSLRSGVAQWQLALHELVGLFAYRLTGRI